MRSDKYDGLGSMSVHWIIAAEASWEKKKKKIRRIRKEKLVVFCFCFSPENSKKKANKKVRKWLGEKNKINDVAQLNF